MCKFLKSLLFLIVLIGCGENTNSDETTGTSRQKQTLELPQQSNLWVFVMAGQSNMTGRGTIEPRDTIRNNRIFAINNKNDIVLAQEPLHFYEPSGAGLDCGMSFGLEMLKNVPLEVSILLIPTAVGGSSIEQWINDETWRGVALSSNFRERVKASQKHGTLKGILWHQGESDAHKGRTKEEHLENMGTLFGRLRAIVGQASLPIVVGKLGSFGIQQKQWDQINASIEAYASSDDFCEVIETFDLKHKGDSLHFNSAAQREMGKRYARAILELIN
ncbi:sialate O-acetylesterase [Ulvibacterium sp.]|uniref:sialate O-acetylesterase n=1 Tax=Ulvibacterium sp. TaxID=2665914 RepID=UPI003BA860B8